VTALLVIQRLRAGDRDWYVTVREERRHLYTLGGACLLVLFAVLWWSGAPALLRACLVGGIVANAIGATLNRVTKPSVHAGSAAGCAVLLGHLAPAATPVLLALVAAVSWARLRLAHHTPGQIALGAGITALCVEASLRLFAA
jgi:membrane-associated phospholipid phosphatase